VTIQDLGSVGELIAAVATVVTLAYLATQLRQNSTVAKATAAISHTESTNNIALLLGQNPDLAKLYFDGLAGEPLSEAAKRQFEMLIGAWLFNQNQSYVLEKQGFLDSEFIASRDSSLHWIVHQPGFRRYWSTWAPMQPPQFAAVIEEKMGQPNPNAALQIPPADSA
jgi:hypothetical protein